MKNQTGREFNINEEMASTVEVIKVVILKSSLPNQDRKFNSMRLYVYADYMNCNWKH